MEMDQVHDCFAYHSEQWVYLNKGQNFAAFLCPSHEIVYSFVIRKNGQLTYMRQRMAFCEEVLLRIFPEIVRFEPDNFKIAKTNSITNLDSVLQLLESKSSATITNRKEFAVNINLSTCVYRKTVELRPFECVSAKSSVFSVELKPKCGLFNIEVDDNFPELSSLTRHKLLLFNRMKGHDIKIDYLYDPAELFSGDSQTQVDCVSNLMKHGSKYLKLYFNSCRMDIDSLQDEMTNDSSFRFSISDLSILIAEALRNSGVLNLLRKWLIMGTISVSKVRDILKGDPFLVESLEHSSVDYGCFKTLIKKLELVNLEKKSDMVSFVKSLDSADYVRLYLLGASGADVSVFFSFINSRDGVSQVISDDISKSRNIAMIELKGSKLLYSCNLIDVDFKGATNIEKQFNELEGAAKYWRRV